MADFLPSPEEEDNRSGLEPELGGFLRDAPERSGLEPELGGVFNTFYIEPDYGRSRVIRQDGDAEEIIQEAIDTCPVDCIHWVDYTELKKLEEERKYQVIPVVGYPVEQAVAASERRRKKQKLRSKKSRY
jgi:ferredoxin